MTPAQIIGSAVALLGAASWIAFAGSPAMAQSAKATAKVTELVSLNVVNLDSVEEVTDDDFVTILEQTIKTANAKDLFIDVSLECGLYTSSRVSTQAGTEASAEAQAGVRVRVLVDGEPALPAQSGLTALNGFDLPLTDGVSFCTRVQRLSASLQGILSCPAGAEIQIGCTLTDEEIELILATLNANAFNFVAPDLGSGNHTVEVQAVGYIGTDVSNLNSSASAGAFAGAGSVTIESVRMIKGEDVVDID